MSSVYDLERLVHKGVITKDGNDFNIPEKMIANAQVEYYGQVTPQLDLKPGKDYAIQIGV